MKGLKIHGSVLKLPHEDSSLQVLTLCDQDKISRKKIFREVLRLTFDQCFPTKQQLAWPSDLSCGNFGIVLTDILKAKPQRHCSEMHVTHGAKVRHNTNYHIKLLLTTILCFCET